MTKKKAMGKAKRTAKSKMKREQRTSVEQHTSSALDKALDKAPVVGGFMTFAVHGDSVGGEVLSMETVKGRWGEQTKVTVRTEGGSKTFFAPTMLQRFLDENAVKVGDTLAVRYESDMPTGKGAPAKMFKVVHMSK